MASRASRVESFVHVLITVTVGGIGGAVGFRHTHDWAVANGQAGWVAWAVAVVIECMVIVAGLELKRSRGFLPAAVLVAAFLMQMAAQVASAPRTPAGWLIAATPALGFLVIVKLLFRRLNDPVQPSEQSLSPAPSVPAPPVAQPEATPVAATAERQDQAPAPVDVPQLESAPVPAPPVPDPSPLLPVPRVEVPVTASMTWMAPAVRDRVRDRARSVIADGRDLVASDLADLDGLLPAQLPALTTEINSAVNR